MAADISQSKLNLTPEEKRLYGQLFQQADNERIGVVTGDVAVKFFERTKLEPSTLAQIWQLSDTENRGLLTPSGFSVALRLIGHCQAGREPSVELATKPAPLPRFDSAAAPPAVAGSPISSPLPAQNSGPIRVPPLTSDKVTEFTGLFERAGARNGFLAGDAARQMFERARLPNETLGRIWNLSDSEERGALNLTEFIVAMHLITSMKSGSLRALPLSLPPGLFEAANRRGFPPTGARGIVQQLTGSGSQRAQSPLSRPPQFGTPPLSADSTGSDWVIQPQDKAKFDQIFASIDTGRTGYINGEQAVPFFSTSGLSEDTLASIWDLADINSEGQLNRDEFAVAMYLIRQQRSKTSDRGNLPTSLPSQLVPPSMRQRTMPPSQPTAPAFDNAANAPKQAQPKSAADDLFGLDALSENDHSPQVSATPASPVAASRSQPILQAQSTGFKPFVPTSSFGQGLTQQDTGGSVSSNQPQNRNLMTQSTNDDLLGDNDPEVSNKLTSETTELGNMSNQIGTLRTQMSEIQAKKSGMEGEISSHGTQKRELESRLAQFRSQYEQEVRQVKSLEDHLNASRAETRKFQQDLGMIEGTHADLQTRHRDLLSQLEADQKENASLKERTNRLNAEVAELKPQLEKLQADTRQQRGLVAINKKQLATSEAERDRIQLEIKEAGEEKARLEHEHTETIRQQQEHETARQQQEVERAKQKEELENARQMRDAATAQASRQMSPIASPTASISGQSTNPFFRKAAASSSERIMSPSIFTDEFASSQGKSTFDSFFGPSDSASQPPPETSFRPATPQSPSNTMSPTSQGSTSFERGFASEPPEPPESRQISSSALPLRMATLRRDSIGSSVKANAPASRAGDSDTGTPTQAAGTPTESIDGDVERNAKRSSSSEPASARSAEEPVDNLTPTLGSTDSSRAAAVPEAVASSVPGAFPDDTPTVVASTLDKVEPTPEEENSSTGASDIFGSGHAGGNTTSNAEFPPIRELDQDDDSDSEIERGFDDDFTSSQPSVAGIASPVPTDAVESISSTNPLSTSKSNGLEVSSDDDTSQLPTPKTEKSPPTYDQATPRREDRGSNQFPREYGGLLPSREMTDLPPAEVPQSPPHDLVGAQTMKNSTLQSPHQQQEGTSDASAETAKPPPADDFDSAFDDLSEAKEDSADQDAFVSSQRDDHEWNPTFDSPAPSQRTLAADTPASTTRVTNHQFSNSFGSAFGSSTATGGTAAAFYGTNGAPGGQSTLSSGHDWDDLFSGLDNSAVATNGSKDPFDLDTTSRSGEIHQGSATTASLDASTRSATGLLDQQVNPTSPPQLSRKQSYSPPPGPPPSKQHLAARPAAPIRGLSTSSEHDDPILKQLTGMGYQRDKALKALERFDYNIDMAANYLAAHSK